MNENIAIKKNKIRLFFYLGSLSAMLFIVMCLSYIYSRSLTQEFNRKIAQLSSGIINEKKRFINNAVERTIFMIETEREKVLQEFGSRNLTQEKLDSFSVDRISDRIRKLRLIDDGYVWVNRIVDYKGGDNYAIRQIHPNLPGTEGEWLSTNTTDIGGNRPYEIELNGIKENGEIYFDYYFKKLDSEKIAHKLSYAKLYKPWNWIVATGVYLDDVDQLIQEETRIMEKTLKNQKTYSFCIVVFSVLLSSGILILFEKMISKLIRTYEQDIEKYTNTLIKEKENIEIALKEIKQLKGMLPICSKCKKIRDDKGYWNLLESYIENHSDASFSHGICPECSEQLYGNESWFKKMKKNKGIE